MLDYLKYFDGDDTFKTDLEIEKTHVDNAETAAAGLLDDMLPSTASSDTIAEWERVLGIVPASGAALADRRKHAAAKYAAIGGLNKLHFEAIAVNMGFMIGAAGATDPHLRIIEGSYPPFRADYGRADIDEVYDHDFGSSVFTVRVSGTDLTTNTELQDLFNTLKPTHVEFVYQDE